MRGAHGVNGLDAESTSQQSKIFQRIDRVGYPILVQYSVIVNMAHQVQVDPLLGNYLDASARVDLQTTARAEPAPTSITAV